MKILVTVGTTSFDSLIAAVDELAHEFDNLDIISQIGQGAYQPVHHPFFKFERNILKKYADRSVITHCGAGSVYQLLERGDPFIAVPNLERDDDHQKEIARYLEEEKFALVCQRPEDISSAFKSDAWKNFHPNPYVKDAFFVADEILSIIDRVMKSD